MKIKDIRENTTEDIVRLIKETENEVLKIKIKKTVADGSVQSHKIRPMRRDIARMQTVIREREMKKND